MEDHDYKSGYTSKTIEVMQPSGIVAHLSRVSPNKKNTLYVATVNEIFDEELTS